MYRLRSGFTWSGGHVDVKLPRREEDIKWSWGLLTLSISEVRARENWVSSSEGGNRCIMMNRRSWFTVTPIFAPGWSGIDISRLTRVHLTVTAYYNERARISDHESRRWRGRIGGERKGRRVRAETEGEREREREREQCWRGWTVRAKGERRQAFTCGRHPMMHSCCWHAGTSGSHDLSSAAIIHKAQRLPLLRSTPLPSCACCPSSLTVELGQ